MVLYDQIREDQDLKYRFNLSCERYRPVHIPDHKYMLLNNSRIMIKHVIINVLDLILINLRIS